MRLRFHFANARRLVLWLMRHSTAAKRNPNQRTRSCVQINTTFIDCNNRCVRALCMFEHRFSLFPAFRANPEARSAQVNNDLFTTIVIISIQFTKQNYFMSLFWRKRAQIVQTEFRYDGDGYAHYCAKESHAITVWLPLVIGERVQVQFPWTKR